MTNTSAVRPPLAEFARYFAASAFALVVDMTILLLAAKVMHYLLAASLGFVVGAVVSYLLATRWVFGRRQLVHRRRTEFAVYAVVGLLGLGLNDLVIFLAVDKMALPLLAGKIVAAGITFLFNYAVRKLVLF
jgi:putative flippase GtrA